MLNFFKKIFKKTEWANSIELGKGEKFIERFREIVADPINIYIERVPNAGYVESKKYIILHNGNKVHLSGKYSYYGEFSDILIINRGVHEPLEEFCFQSLLRRLKSKRENIKMLELGAYWGHYSMWMKRAIPEAECTLVEPDKKNLLIGKMNFKINNFNGKFINEFVCSNGFTVDKWIGSSDEKLDLLHCDIQGFELEMLHNAKRSLETTKINYLMISTHSEKIHKDIIKYMAQFKYQLEVSSDFERHTTSNDGFLMFTSINSESVFKNFSPLGRCEIINTKPEDILMYLYSNKSNLNDKIF
jgi:hypothetical protein